MASDDKDFGNFAAKVVGGIIGGTIVGLAWGGKKLYDKLKGEQKIYCPKCRNKVSVSSKVCNKCGYTINYDPSYCD